MRANLEIPLVKVSDKKELTKYISSFLLGDGGLKMSNERSKNAMYIFSQIASHEDYIIWQAGILKNITDVSIYVYEEGIQSQGALAKRSFRLNTKCHPFYTTLYERHYLCGRKVVSPHDLKLLDWQSLAIWYMDDGYLHTSSDTPYICTECYSFGDCLLLKKVLYERFGIMSGTTRRKKQNGEYGYRLRLSNKTMNRFFSGIEPYIFPSFKYKLGSRTIDPLKEGDEIVCSSLEDEEVDRNDLPLEEILE